MTTAPQQADSTGRSGPAGWFARPQARRWTCPPVPDDARRFHAGLPGYAPTPLAQTPGLAAELGVGQVLVKDESARFDLGAFKFLGASWAAYRVVAARTDYPGEPSLTGLRAWLDGLPPGSVRPVLSTATDGNHGRALARAARLLGLTARVVVPRRVPVPVVDRIRAEGAEVTLLPGSYDDAVEAARRQAEQDPRIALVQDMGWPGYQDVPGWTVDGYSTLLHELDGQLARAGLPGPHLVAVPVGVGSLAQAVVLHYRSRPAADVRPALLGVEPDTAACVLAGLTEGRRHTVPTGSTVMNGLNCGTPSASAWPVLTAGLDAAVAVTDGQSRQAVVDLARAGVTAGPNGAASLAGARAALTGAAAEHRRAALGLPSDPVVILISTEGFAGDQPVHRADGGASR